MLNFMQRCPQLSTDLDATIISGSRRVLVVLAILPLPAFAQAGDALFALLPWLIAAATTILATLVWTRARARPRAASSLLTDSHRVMESVVETAVDAIIVIDEHGVVQAFNRSAERMFGYRQDEIIGKKVNMLMPAPHAEHHDAYIKHYFATGEKKIIGIGRFVDAQRKDGTIFPVHLAVSQVSDVQTLFTGIIHDMSARRALESSLQEHETRLQMALRSAQLRVWEWDLLRDTVTLRDGDEATTTDADGGRATPCAQLLESVHPDERTRVEIAMDKVHNGEPENMEVRYLSADGRVGWLRVHCTPIAGSDGNVERVVGLFRDISATKEVSEQLRASEEELRSVVLHAPLAILTVGLSGRVESANRAACELLGCSQSELSADEFLDNIHPQDRARARMGMKQALAGEREAFKMELRLRHRDGHFLDTEFHNSIVCDSDGTAAFLICQIVDLTESRQREAELADQRARLTHVARLSTLGEMAAGIAHEINQPLTAIASYTQACTRLLRLGKGEDAKVLEALDAVGNQALRAGEVIRRMRALVKKTDTQREPKNLNELIEDLQPLIGIDARGSGVAVNLEFAGHLPNVHVDPVQIQQVILNLARNAIEATVDGSNDRRGVVVRTQTDSPDRVKITVMDYGHGMTTEVKKQITTPFFTTKENGMGMGVSICQSIISAHGGQFGYEDNPAGGAIFWFTLPAIQEELADEKTA